MKAHLMHPSRDFELDHALPPNAESLMQDLELGTLLDAMARGDDFLRRSAEATLFEGLVDPDEIRYRQRILEDCLNHPELARQLYHLAVEGVEAKQNVRLFWFRDSPDALLQKSLSMLALLADVLERLRRIAEENEDRVVSAGLTRLFATLRQELDDEYLATVYAHLRELSFKRGALISADLGRGNRGTSYALRRPRDRKLIERLTPLGSTAYSFTIPPRDEHGHEALAALRNRGIRSAAAALAQSIDHILGFFASLRAELAFYVGCVNLSEWLVERGAPTCFPEPVADGGAFSCRGVYDVSLALHLPGRVVGNDIDADGKHLVLITGANQGGKSTFLRSVGLSQLMMQAGMFVGANSFRASVHDGVFTHFKREEDASMTHGKLAEELARMSEIVGEISPHGLLLCNESFASTNEQEGSEIARQVVRALTDSGVHVHYVTHLYDLASSIYEERSPSALFLRAERKPDGTRTFRVVPGGPLPTSHGQDSYRRIFGGRDSAGDAAAAAEIA